MRKLGIIVSALAALFIATGCMGTDDTAPTDERLPALEEALASPSAFEVDFSATTLTIEVAGQWVSDDGTFRRLELEVQQGEVTLSAEGDQLDLQALRLELDDVEVGQSYATPEGGKLTHIALSLDRPVVADCQLGDSHAESSDLLDLRLDWTLVLPSGTTFDLGSPVIADLPFDLDVERHADGELVLDLDVVESGELFALDGVVEVTAIDASVRAHATP